MNKPFSKPMRLIGKVAPGIEVARSYQRRWLRADLIAGVTIFAMLVPQGMAYGELAGVAPVVGLYTALAALIGYAVFGSSRRLMIGPEANSAILVATALVPVAAGAIPRVMLCWLHSWHCWWGYLPSRQGLPGWASSPTLSPNPS